MRPLPTILATALSAGTRRPAYKLYAWKDSTYTQIITGVATETPLDLTPYITEIKWTTEQLTCGLSDPDGDLHPDYGVLRAYLANGVILRLKEGDLRIDEAAWVWTFTGRIKGQYGYARSRQDNTFTGQVLAYHRAAEQSFNRRKITTRAYTKGTDLGLVVGDVLGMLGVTPAERRVPSALGLTFHHTVNQIAQMTPWEALTTLLFPACMVPFADGEGRLAAYWKTVSRAPDLVLPDYLRVHRLEATGQTGEPKNKVVVQYLDSNLTEVEGPDQKLGSANITTGFFTSKEELLCYWSEDRKQRARRTYLKVIKSINDNLLPVGTESYQELDAYSGKITITISAWVPTLAGAMLAAYLAAAYKPDKTESTATNKAPITLTAPGEVTLTAPPTGGPVTGTITIAPAKVSTTEDQGFTIPWGRVEQAAALIGIMAIMMSLGSAQYEVWGTPYDLVYLEKEQIAIEDGIQYWEENEVVIKNDFIGTQETAEACAVNELCYCRSAFNARKLWLDDLPGLEIGDIIELPVEGRYFITGLSKTVKPGILPVLEIDCFKIATAEVVT